MPEVTKRTSAVDAAIGSKLRALRECKGLAEGDCAVALGISEAAYGKLEAGTERIAAAQLFVLAPLLNATISQFFEDLK